MRWLLTFLCASVFCLRSQTLTWDVEDYYQGLELTAGYRVMVGTNSGSYLAIADVGLTNAARIPRLRLFPVLTNYFVVTAYDDFGNETPYSEEIYYWRTNLYVALPVTNVTLRVPSGKFYVERGDTTAVWLSSSTVTGPTNISFPIAGTMGFYRWRPYFLSVASPKSGATKLMAKKQPMFKAKPILALPTTNAPPMDLNRINLDPSKAPR